jgi:SAM-dependent methyltransferase
MPVLKTGCLLERRMHAHLASLCAMKRAPARRLLGQAWPSPPAHEIPDRQGVLRLRPPRNGRVHLGCGDRYLRGYLNVDYPPAEGTAAGTSRPDLQGDVRTLLCPAGTLAEVRLHHLFEHFDRAPALALLIRWYDWLRPGGRLQIETPDFDACIGRFADRSIKDQSVILRHLFGSQEAPWALHRDGWSANRFRYVLGELGFTGIATSQTYSDQGRVLANVLVTAHRPSAAGPTRAEQVSSALAILRQSMNGEGSSEETLFDRWRSELDDMCGDGDVLVG